MTMAVESPEPLYRIPGWELLDQFVRETWGCSLATVLGWSNLGMATVYTPPPILSVGAGFVPIMFAGHVAIALLFLAYGAVW